jgi:RNA polymerase sigma-70 factor (ECF subfamily)
VASGAVVASSAPVASAVALPPAETAAGARSVPYWLYGLNGSSGSNLFSEPPSGSRIGDEYSVVINVASASDGALVVAVGRWHEQALAEIYRRHGGAVHALARRLLGSDHAADDVTQEVFIKLWEAPERFDPTRGGLRSFLLAAAHSRAVDQLRSQSARRAREERDATHVASAGYDLERHAWDLHLSEQVRNAVGCLPDTERRAIELAYFGGRTYREVAVLLGEPEGTVKGRIRAGLKRLRQALEREGAHL